MSVKICSGCDDEFYFTFYSPNMRCSTDFHREIVSEMGELGVLGPTIKGKQKSKMPYWTSLCAYIRL